jgi:arylsulfatase A-like enzyme
LVIISPFQREEWKTLWAGKHHSRENPVNRGFDHFSGLFDGASNHFNPGEQRPGEGIPAQKRNAGDRKSKYDVPYRNWVIEGEIISPYTPKKDFYSTDAFTDYAINWINDTKDNNPFFLYLAYTAPHDPLMAWPEDIEKYKGMYQDGFEIIRKKRFLKQKNMGIISKNTNLSLAEHERWENLSDIEQKIESKKMQVYAAMIDRIDQNIGRLLDLLKSKGELDNTLILFASDNGGSSENAEKEVNNVGPIGSLTNWKSLKKNWANVSNTPYRNYKNWSHEGGIKTPLIAYWPNGIKYTNMMHFQT